MVHSGLAALAVYGRELVEGLAVPEGVFLVFDAPSLYAFGCVPLLQRRGRVLVITANMSAPYLRDLVTLEPDGLLALPASSGEIRRYLMRVADGESFHLLPPLGTDPLTPLERMVLRNLALGLDNGQIAQKLDLGKKTVSNRVSEICSKLGVRGRTQAALHYLGLLPGCRPEEARQRTQDPFAASSHAHPARFRGSALQ
jgi:DNA-binding CsgD family transcriptional regulator